MKEVTCPACGGLIEAECLADLVHNAQEHAWAAHRYRLPEEHVRADAVDG